MKRKEKEEKMVLEIVIIISIGAICAHIDYRRAERARVKTTRVENKQ